MDHSDIASDYWKPVRIGLGFIAVFFGTFVVWAVLAPIQLGAVAGGQVVVASYTKVVQHQYGGTVKEILVKDGDVVEAGQVLLRLEDAPARAQFAQARGEYVQALAVQARLLAEKNGAAAIRYPEEVLAMREDPAVRRVMAAQEELFRARREKHANDVRVLQRALEGFEDYARKLEAQSQAHERERAALSEQLQAVSGLARDGYYPKNRLLDIRRAMENVTANLREVEATRARVLASMKETQARLEAVRSDYLKEVEDQLAEATRRLSALHEQYAAAKDHLEKTEIRAPEAGMVMNLRIRTVGGVISPGQPIVQIVPRDARFIVEARVSPADIEEVQPGREAVLRFIAIDPKKSPTFTGKVVYVSPDALYDEAHRVSFYLCRIELSPETVEQVAAMGKEVIPGMPVQVTVKKSMTTFFAYLWKPFTDRLAIAFSR
ncbi:HlyD family type I secretion periplasmic adaptor subunit [Desulfosoma sp.]